MDYDLSNKMSLEYYYLICQSVGTATDTVEGQKIDVIADIPAIQAMVETLLQQMA
jgi:hypothetical protein